MKKNNLKKWIKYIGNGLSIIAIVIIVNKFLGMNIDLNVIWNFRSMAFIIFALCLQSIMILLAGYPWKKIVEMFSFTKISFLKVINVFVKSNIYKYVPGNVFQYVARNELAVLSNISHVDVALSTAADTVGSLGVALVFSFFLLREDAVMYIKENLDITKFAFVFLVGVISVLVIGIILYMSFKDKIVEKINQYKRIISKDNIVDFFKILLFYVANNIINCIIYGIIFLGVLGETANVREILILMGSLVFSTIVGVITPGASGGIGVREAVMMFMTEEKFSLDAIVFSMLILRGVSILADVMAFGIIKLNAYIKKERRNV